MEINSGNDGCGAVQVLLNTRIGGNPVTMPDGSVPQPSLQLVDPNKDRKEVILQNVGIVTIYVGLGFPPTITNYSFALLPCATAHDGTGGIFVSDNWRGAISATGAIAGGLLAITEEV